MTGLIILCRYNSNRLPGKILKEINGKTILKYIYERLSKINLNHEIIIATSNLESDDIIEKYCLKNKYKCFRGSLSNVSKRFLDCGIKNNFENLVRINGDNLFLDFQLLEKMILDFEKNKYKFMSNVKKRTWPKGISVEIVNTDYYKKSVDSFSEDDKEHVMTYFYRNITKDTKFIYNNVKIESNLDFAIDSYEDFILANKIINKMKNNHSEYNYLDIIDIANQIKNEK